jgi:hypothetical protein
VSGPLCRRSLQRLVSWCAEQMHLRAASQICAQLSSFASDAQCRRLGTDTTSGSEVEPRDMKAIGKDLLKVVDTLKTDQLKKAAEILGISQELLRRDDGKPLQPVRTHSTPIAQYQRRGGYAACIYCAPAPLHPCVCASW